jgi:hypothetical protein
MELAFRTLRIRALCEDPDLALVSLKPDVVEHLKSRLADLRAAESPLDLLAGAPQLMDGKAPRIAIRLGDSHMLACEVNHVRPRADDTGRIDWIRVRRVKITSIAEVPK